MESAHPRITILALNYAPEFTGIAPYVAALSEQLALRGYPVKVISSHPHYPAWQVRPGFGQWRRRSTESGVEVVRLKHFVPAAPTTNFTRLVSELSFGLRAMTEDWGNPQVLLLVSPGLFSSACAIVSQHLRRGPRPRTVLWVQDIYSAAMEETAERGRADALMRRFEALTLRHVDHIVAIHDRFRRRLVESLDVREQDISVVRNWTHLVRPKASDSAAVRDRFGWGPQDIVVLHAGNQGAKQHLYQVLAAAQEAHRRSIPIRFVLVGTGNQHQNLLAAAAGISNVEFIPPLPDDDYQAVMRAADILLVSEGPHVREMSVPSKLTSYFNAGRPVLGITDEGSISAEEIGASGAGLTVPPDNPAAAVDAICSLMGDPLRYAEYCRNGPTFVAQHLSQAAAVDRFLSALALRDSEVFDLPRRRRRRPPAPAQAV